MKLWTRRKYLYSVYFKKTKKSNIFHVELLEGGKRPTYDRVCYVGRTKNALLNFSKKAPIFWVTILFEMSPKMPQSDKTGESTVS